MNNMGSNEPWNNMGPNGPGNNMGPNGPMNNMGSNEPWNNMGPNGPGINMGPNGPGNNVGPNGPPTSMAGPGSAQGSNRPQEMGPPSSVAPSPGPEKRESMFRRESCSDTETIQDIRNRSLHADAICTEELDRNQAIPVNIDEESLASGGSTGLLLRKLAGCVIKAEKDADLAMTVSNALVASLREYYFRRGELKVAELLMTAELKLNTLKAMKVGLKLLDNELNKNSSSKPSSTESSDSLKKSATLGFFAPPQLDASSSVPQAGASSSSVPQAGASSSNVPQPVPAPSPAPVQNPPPNLTQPPPALTQPPPMSVPPPTDPSQQYWGQQWGQWGQYGVPQGQWGPHAGYGPDQGQWGQYGPTQGQYGGGYFTGQGQYTGNQAQSGSNQAQSGGKQGKQNKSAQGQGKAAEPVKESKEASDDGKPPGEEKQTNPSSDL